MSWFSTLVPFVAGFFKGFLEEYSPPRPVASVPSPRNYDFHAHMRQLVAASGLPIDHESDHAVGFTIPAHGSDYPVVLLGKGTQIAIRAHSDCSFPAGGVPRAVTRTIQLLNSEEEHYSFGVADAGDRGSLLCVTTIVSSHTLTPDSFQAVIATLVQALIAFERMLEQYGYAG